MKKDMTLEEAMKKLEQTVSRLESGDIELEKALKLFEEATALSAYCSKKISDTDQKITELVNKVSAEQKEDCDGE